jgi:hypothetical protein
MGISMKFELSEGIAANSHLVNGGESFDDWFSAEEWAKNWVRNNAKKDAYTLQCDGKAAMSLFKTDAGQWYITPAHV